MSGKLEELQLKVARLSRRTHELGIPIMVLFEGIPASGKTRLSNELLLHLDAKYSRFIATKSPEIYVTNFYKNIGILYHKRAI